MPPTSAITVSTDRREYSAYYDPVAVVTAFVTLTSPTPGATVTASLVRAGGYGIVATKQSVPIVSDKAEVTFDLRTDAVDANGIFRAILGEYYVQAQATDASVMGTSAQFHISPTSVQEVKDTLLRGVDLLASNVMKARQQPVNVSGVTIMTTANIITRGVYNLVFTNTGPTLAWDGGVAVPVSRVGSNTYVLVSSDGRTWVEVDVIGERLPVADKTDAILIDADRITDADIRTILTRAYGNLQGRINVTLEPRDIDTERKGMEFYDASQFTDYYVNPATYYQWQVGKNWLTLKFPFGNLIKVYRLEGFFQASKTLVVPVDNWVTINKKAGEVDFVPRYGATLLFQFVGVPFFAFMHRFDSIPSFWHYRATIGLDDLRNDHDRARVRECMLRWGAMDVLVQAGQASAPGLLGESTAKDGVSESRSYAQGAGGRYANLVTMHSNFLFGAEGETGEIKRLKDKFGGVIMVVL